VAFSYYSFQTTAYDSFSIEVDEEEFVQAEARGEKQTKNERKNYNFDRCALDSYTHTYIHAYT
jgi:hypothetical protein